MLDATAGKTRIREYFDDKKISLTSIATYFSIHKQDLNDYPSGKNQNKEAYETLTAIIEYYKVKWECLEWKIL